MLIKFNKMINKTIITCKKFKQNKIEIKNKI